MEAKKVLRSTRSAVSNAQERSSKMNNDQGPLDLVIRATFAMMNFRAGVGTDGRLDHIGLESEREAGSRHSKSTPFL